MFRPEWNILCSGIEIAHFNPDSMTKLAIMQPYFIPYPGYFKLMKSVDRFIVYDTVQFPRRGWVHRNRLLTASNELDWITLPLKKKERDVEIRDLEFRENACDEFLDNLHRFPIFQPLQKDIDLFQLLTNFQLSVVDYLVGILKYLCGHLNVACEIEKASILQPVRESTGQEAIITLAKMEGCTEYVNLPGGVDLYDRQEFLRNGINLTFVDCEGIDKSSVLQQYVDDPAALLRNLGR